MSAIHWADLDRLRVGDTASCEVIADERCVEAFARLSEDDNPLHMDAGAARAYGFPQRVAHGMIALCAISRLIGTRLPGPGALWVSSELRFPSPVLLGDTVTAQVTVERISQGARMVSLRAQAVSRATGASVLTGSVQVRIPTRTGGGASPA